MEKRGFFPLMAELYGGTFCIALFLTIITIALSPDHDEEFLAYSHWNSVNKTHTITLISGDHPLIIHPQIELTGLATSEPLSPDGKLRAKALDQRTPNGDQFPYLVLIDQETGDETIVYQGSIRNGNIGEISWSPSGKQLAFQEMCQSHCLNLVIVDAVTKKVIFLKELDQISEYEWVDPDRLLEG